MSPRHRAERPARQGLLGVIVVAASDSGLATAVGMVLPGGPSLPDLLGIAAVSALLANLLNNLPAILIFAPVAVASDRAARLARRALRMSSPDT